VRSIAVLPVLASLVVGGVAAAGGGKDEGLRYRRSYEEAMWEARARNLPIFVTRHKDG
jgi:hypothetical protein